jgi:hypothetical protein
VTRMRVILIVLVAHVIDHNHPNLQELVCTGSLQLEL